MRNIYLVALILLRINFVNFPDIRHVAVVVQDTIRKYVNSLETSPQWALVYIILLDDFLMRLEVGSIGKILKNLRIYP